jgi:hypothetical protein
VGEWFDAGDAFRARSILSDQRRSFIRLASQPHVSMTMRTGDARQFDSIGLIRWVAASLLLICLRGGSAAWGQVGAIEKEVIDNIQSQSAGPFEVRDQHLPEPFLRQAADRVIRSSFRQRYRIVLSDQASVAAGGGALRDGGPLRGSEGAGDAGAALPPVRPLGESSGLGRLAAWGAAGFVVCVALAYVALLRYGRRRA